MGLTDNLAVLSLESSVAVTTGGVKDDDNEMLLMRIWNFSWILLRSEWLRTSVPAPTRRRHGVM